MTLAHPALSRRLTGHQLTAYGLLVVLPAIGTLAILRAGAGQQGLIFRIYIQGGRRLGGHS